MILKLLFIHMCLAQQGEHPHDRVHRCTDLMSKPVNQTELNLVRGHLSRLATFNRRPSLTVKTMPKGQILFAV